MSKNQNKGIEISYQWEIKTINSDNIKELKLLNDRRNTTDAHVKHLLNLLEANKHFEAPFVINHLTEQNVDRIIDGNHRYKAMQKWIEDDKNNAITVPFCIYHDLTPAQERHVYTIWNSGKKQSSDDFIKMYAPTIPFLRNIKQARNVYVLGHTPITIYGLKSAQHGVHFAPLIKSYFSATRFSSPHFEIYTNSRGDFVEDCQNQKYLGDEDTKNIIDFIKFFESIFGRLQKDNKYTTNNWLACTMIIFMDNINKRDELAKRIRKKVMNDEQLITLGKYSNVKAYETLYREIISRINNDKSLKIRNVYENIMSEEALRELFKDEKPKNGNGKNGNGKKIIPKPKEKNQDEWTDVDNIGDDITDDDLGGL